MPSHPARDDIDLLDGTWYAREPHDDWEWMRRNAPVYYDRNSDTWAITRYHDVLAIEKDPATFSSRRSPRPHGNPLPMMISMDNPDHQRRRSLVNRGFTPRRVAEKEPAIRAICTEIIDRVCERGECDFVWDIAAPLPLLLIAEMLGFERESYDDLLRWSDDLIRGTTINDERAAEVAMNAALEFREYQLGVIADRRSKPPQPDVVSILCYAEIDGERLDDESLIQETLLILIGGDETTRDVEIGDQLVHEGDQLVLMYPSANRDEDVFERPFALDVRRQPNPHLAFGFGPHFCLGAALARLELKVMFSELLRRLPDIELATDDPLPYRSSNFIVGPEAMPVRFTPTAPAR